MSGPKITPSLLIASGLGSGFFPIAPGTAGSLAALPSGIALLLLPGWVLPMAILSITLLGLWAVTQEGRGHPGEWDPPWVVIDEWAGQWMAMLPLASPRPLGVLAAFALFRFFDIVKPGPVGWADRQPGAAGVMADDLIAGLLAAGVLWAVESRYPDLLVISHG